MTERLRSASTAGYHCPKMENDLSPRKTMLVLVIVVGCFAVLWPKVFYPMLVGSANQQIKPSPIDKTTGCCDVISETDVNTIKIMSELCGTIIKADQDKPLTGKEIVQKCRQEVLETCGIDISVVLQEQVRLGQNVKQILDEIRSLNGSLCLKYNYGVAPWKLGVPHRISVNVDPSNPNIRQERPLHLRSELIHPAFRERGRAIPQPQPATPVRPPPRVVEGRPGPVPGMRPTIGGAGHVVPPPKQGTSSMSVIMPIYTIGIVIFFTYTLMKIIFKKQPESVGGSLYPPVDPDPHFRKEVFESESSRLGARLTRENISSKLVVNAMSALLDEVDQEIEARRKSSEVASQDLVNGTLSNGDAVKPQDEEQPTVKVLGMEMTASCEGGKKWSRPDSPVLPTSPPPPVEPVPPPQEIYLEGALPAQSHLLVADSATEPEPTTGEDPAVVLSGKMTLSVISLESENGGEAETTKTEDTTQEPVIEYIEEDVQKSTDLEDRGEEIVQEFEDREGSVITNEAVATKTEEAEPIVQLIEEVLQPFTIEKEFLQKLKEENDIQPPLIMLESEDVPHTVEVEKLEREVDDLIQEAIENVQQRETKVDTLETLSRRANEINDNLQNLGQSELETVQIPETSRKQTSLQVSDGVLEIKEKENTPKIEPTKQEIDSAVANAVQERKDVETKDEILGNTVLTKSEVSEEKVSPIMRQIQDLINKEIEITEKIEEHREPVLEYKIEPNQVEESDKEKTKPTEETQNSLSKTVENLESKESSDQINSVKVDHEEKAKLDSAVVKEATVLEKTKEQIETTKPDKNLVENVEEKPKLESKEAVTPISKTEEVQAKTTPSDEEELDSDEEIVEEIEEIVYEEESEEEVEDEEIEIEVEEESEEEMPDERNTTRTESSSVQRVNGERSEDLVEESKYTTASGATAAENDISDEELTDNEDVDDEEEIIEVEEEIEDDDYIGDEGNDVNHVSGDSDPEL
ncbi:hypothetical protein MTP99_001816 [Tenebrio molitor]|nr:hypothetical protein MTP99_001816 [Tenebrio molitor]